MWCTRWYLPLLFLPFPKASPYFVFLYLVSVTMHVKPCLYCIILLSALYSSTCYWEPVPTALLLERNPHLLNATDPYKVGKEMTVLVDTLAAYENATAASLNDTSAQNATVAFQAWRMRTTGMPLTRLHERCWCDFAPLLSFSDNIRRRWGATNETVDLFGTFGFFDPFNQRGWESASLVRHAKALAAIKQSQETPASPETAEASIVVEEKVIPETQAKAPLSSYDKVYQAGINRFWRPLQAFGKRVASQRMPGGDDNSPTSGIDTGTAQPPLPPISPEPEQPPPLITTDATAGKPITERPIPDIPVPFARLWVTMWRKLVHFFSQRYDLTDYGLPVVVDFRWSRA